MKPVYLFSLFVFLAACDKAYQAKEPLVGVWVEKTYREDSLQVYRSNGKTIMFDNSVHYRMSGRMFPQDKYFRHQVTLKDDKIGFKPFDASDRQEYMFYYFKWSDDKDEFTMSYNGLRPYLSSIGNVTYQRVK